MQGSDGQHEDDASPESLEGPCSHQQPATTSTGGKKGGAARCWKEVESIRKTWPAQVQYLSEEHARAEKAGSSDASDDGQQWQNVRGTHESSHPPEGRNQVYTEHA